MELTTSWKEEGIEIGRQEGRERESRLLLQLLEKRFGRLEQDWETRIRQFSFEELAELGMALLDFKTREELKGWLARH